MTEQSPSAHRFLEFAFLCDAASDKGGALDALGIGTSLVYVRSLPAVHQLTLVIRVAWAGGPVAPGPKQIEVNIAGPDGSAIAGLSGAFAVDANDEKAKNTRHPEVPVGANLIFPIPVQLQQYGLHQVEISFEGDSYSPLAFKVIRADDET